MPSPLALNLGKISGFSQGFTSPDSTTPQGFAGLLTRIVSVMTIFASIAFTLWLIIGALTYIAGDNPQQLDKAKRQMSSAIIGLLITILVIPLAWLIGQITGLHILDFETLVSNITNR